MRTSACIILLAFIPLLVACGHTSDRGKLDTWGIKDSFDLDVALYDFICARRLEAGECPPTESGDDAFDHLHECVAEKVKHDWTPEDVRDAEDADIRILLFIELEGALSHCGKLARRANVAVLDEKAAESVNASTLTVGPTKTLPTSVPIPTSRPPNPRDAAIGQILELQRRARRLSELLSLTAPSVIDRPTSVLQECSYPFPEGHSTLPHFESWPEAYRALDAEMALACKIIVAASPDVLAEYSELVSALEPVLARFNAAYGVVGADDFPAIRDAVYASFGSDGPN